jgi:hypothetical protein
MKKIPVKYQFLGGIIIFLILIVILQIITPKKVISPLETPPVITPTTIITPAARYTEPSANWNTQIENDLKQYEKSNKARVDKALSGIRLNSPILQPDFTIEYSYRTATYTFTLKESAENGKQQALLWLKNIGVSSEDLLLIKVNWVTEP